MDTHVTLERFLSCVGPHVLVQSSFLAEGLVALAALIRLLLRQKIHTSLKESCSTTKEKAAHPWFDHIWRKAGERFTSTMVNIITHMCACRQIHNTVGKNFNETEIYASFKTQACSACQFRKIQNEKLYNSSSVKVLKNTWNLQNGKENIAVKIPLKIYQCSGTLWL